jgi:hypothetical protein
VARILPGALSTALGGAYWMHGGGKIFWGGGGLLRKKRDIRVGL